MTGEGWGKRWRLREMLGNDGDWERCWGWKLGKGEEIVFERESNKREALWEIHNYPVEWCNQTPTAAKKVLKWFS